MKRQLVSLVFLSLARLGIAQSVAADFLSPSTACLEEKITITNSSLNSNRYEWDLCQGDLSLAPVGSNAGTVSGTNIPTGLDVVFDGTGWYGFITSRGNNSIIKVSFGADISTTGVTENLGNISSLMDRPSDIKMIATGGKWYGFVFNEGNNVICRLDFGTSLANTPSAVVLDNTSTSTGNQGLDVIKSGSTWYVVYTFNSKIGVIRLATIESIPLASDKLLTPNLNGSPALGDIKLLTHNGFFYAYTPSYSLNKLYKLSFGADLFSLPTEDDISADLPSFSYYGVDGGLDAGKYHLLLASLSGSMRGAQQWAPEVGSFRLV